MEFSRVDTNFSVQTAEDGTVKDFYRIPCAPFTLYGVTYFEREGRFSRMPEAEAEKISENVKMLSKHTSGGRLRFSTDSDFLEVRATYSSLQGYPRMTYVGSAGFLLLEDAERGAFPFVGSQIAPTSEDKTGFVARVPTAADGKVHDYTLYFPLYNDVTSLEIGLRHGAKVGEGKKCRDLKPILYYGSSITQGGCASRPDNCYQGFIFKWNNVDYLNFGFSGNARGERAAAEYLSRIPCSLFVYDYDFNAPTAEHLEKTHAPFFEIFRRAQPDTPVLILSKIDCESDPAADARRAVIRKTVERARRAGDKNVYFLNGDQFFGKHDRESCTVDSCHPTDLGFYRMAKCIYRKMISIDPIFG